MSRENPLWGAPRIHGELPKLGIDVGEATVSRYMVRPERSPSQSWRTFLVNHARDTVSIDFFTVPTATFQVLYVFLVLDIGFPLETELRSDLKITRSPNCLSEMPDMNK
jgi:hypothetical protein